MTNIPVHNSEKEWESCRSEKRGVSFSITWDTVRVHELLVSVCELVSHKVRRRSRPRLGNVIDKTGHRHVHVGVSFLYTQFDLFEVFGNDPAFSTEHTRDISLEHVERVVNGFLFQDVPSPTFAVLSQHLAEAVASILVLQKDGTRINEFLCILGKHFVNGFGIIHVRKTVSVSLEGVTDLLEFDFNGIRLIENDEYRLLSKLTSFWVGDRLLNRCKSNKAVTTGGTENHAFKVGAFVGRNNTCD
mmetsp:Transcript_17252/g.37749  ORF Transcript_17252/g.37749 Transcript_17252/m.37749 type:complete len:245 (+) Transcript_17252:1509-2243(+)